MKHCGHVTQWFGVARCHIGWFDYFAVGILGLMIATVVVGTVAMFCALVAGSKTN